MDYIGEHLLPGRIGNLLLIISFVFSLVAAYAFYRSFRSAEIEDQQRWKRLGRIAFLIDTACIIGAFIILYTLIAGHRYEYLYVYKNSGNDLEPKYILSSLWSASEGSFLLWSIWHAIFGSVLMFTAKRWEAPVMTIMSIAQFCLVTMMLGIYVFGEKIGSSPFALFREEMSHLPVFGYADYASRIVDGNGLNQLLQNYWMVIHPPVLFMGFASTIVPFAFAIAGLMTRNLGAWVSSALPWALFSAAVLGLGIMMGAAWAYESLSFGGYWAWDPVENASLVPWVVLIAGIHTLLIYKHTGRSLRSTYLFFILSFILIVYSTFLTRSGILGDTSVHSFADLGMNAQLYLFLYIFFWLPTIVSIDSVKNRIYASLVAVALLLLANYVTPIAAFVSPFVAVVLLMLNLAKAIPSVKKEEAGTSREFWMFIGALVLFFSSLLIIGQTSIPVLNKVFNLTIAEPENREFSYNRIQIFIAIIIGLLTAATQYLKYKETSTKYFFKKITIPTLASLVLSALILGFGNIDYDKYGPGYLMGIWMAVISSVYGIIANASYIWLGVKGSLKLSGPSIAHLGFGMMLLGILISASKKEVLSHNVGGIPAPLGSGENPMENLTLVKGIPTTMGKFKVTYNEDSVHPKKPLWFYKLDFESRDGDEQFTLTPNAFVNYQNQEGLMANPDAKHYWDHDIFTYITSLPDPTKNKDTANYVDKTIRKGDTVFYSKGYFIMEELSATGSDSLPVELFGSDGKIYEAKITVHSNTGSTITSSPRLAFAKGAWLNLPDTVTSENLVLKMNEVTGETVNLGIRESNTVTQYLTLKAYKFPFINLLWLGTLLMVTGFLVSMVRRFRVKSSV